MPVAAMVTLYALSTCNHCKSLKKLLEESNVDHDVIEVDRLGPSERSDVLQQVREYNHQVSFPTTIIGDMVVVGNKGYKIREALQALAKT